MAQVPAGIGRQRYCHIGQPNTAKLIAVRIDRRDEMWISLALPWRQRCGDPVRRLPAEIEPRDPRRMRWKPHSRNRGEDGLHRLRCDGAAVGQEWIAARRRRLALADPSYPSAPAERAAAGCNRPNSV